LLLEIGECRGKDVYKFIILYEELYFSEELVFKDFTSSILQKSLGEAMDFYVLSVKELEALEQTIKIHGIEKIIEEKKRIDLECPPGGGHSFLAVCKSLGVTEQSNQWLDETFEKYFQELVHKLQPDSDRISP